jgi:hypothetical protein
MCSPMPSWRPSTLAPCLTSRRNHTAFHLHVCTSPRYLSIPLALPHQPDPAHLTSPLSRCPPLVPSKSNTRQQCAEARLHAKRCCAAAQAARRHMSSPRSRHRLPSAADAATRAILGRRAGAAAVVAVEDVRTPATPYVALSAVRTSVHLVTRTSSVQATGVHATGVIQVSGQTAVRCPRPLRPRCPDRAGSRTSVPRTGHVWRTGFDVSLWSPSGLVVAARIGPGWEGMVERWPCAARTRVDGTPGPPLRRRTGGATRSPPGRPRELVQR